MMQNPEHYPDSQTFNGFRFVEPTILAQTTRKDFAQTLQECPSKLTDTRDENNSWHVWGTGRMAWYVRFFPLGPTASRLKGSNS